MREPIANGKGISVPVDKYNGLLEEMALFATRVYKKEGKAV